MSILLWGYLGRLTFFQKISAFKVYVWWSIVRTAVLFAFWVTQWGNYADAYWLARGITITLTGVVVGELWGQTVAGFALAFPVGLVEFAGSYIAIDREFGFAVCAACALRLIWRPVRILRAYPSGRTSWPDLSNRNPIALGLLVLTLFPAIAETPAILEYGSWLRFIPTLSAVIAQIIWIKGVAFPRSATLFDCGRSFKRSAFGGSRRRARAI